MTRPTVTVVGLGPGSAGHITQEALQAIESATIRFVRTKQHPSASLVKNAVAFDDEYDRHDTFASVYAAIAERVAQAAIENGSALYAVPGSPGVLEDAVQRLLADSRVDVRVLSSVSFLDLAWLRLSVDPVNEGVRLVDAHRFAEAAADDCGPFLVAQCHADWVLSEIKLAHESASGDEEVVVLHRLGLPDERVMRTAWNHLDRLERECGIVVDHLTSLYIPKLAEPVAGEMARLHRLARTLRERCPWDQEQTHASLVRYLIEETYEVVDALNALDPQDPRTDETLIEELGDLLYQVEFHATIAEQEGRFSLADVARATHDKLVRRHPHVFGDVQAETASDVVTTWDEIKRRERATKGDVDGAGAADFFAGVSRSAPSLSLAQKLQKRAAEIGFDWPNVDGAEEKLREEIGELRSASSAGDPAAVRMELGDVLFSVVNVARKLGVDAETALRDASDKFVKRFTRVQELAARRGVVLEQCNLAELDALWDEAKRNG